MVEFAAGDAELPFVATTMRFFIEGTGFMASTSTAAPFIKYTGMCAFVVRVCACVIVFLVRECISVFLWEFAAGNAQLPFMADHAVRH